MEQSSHPSNKQEPISAGEELKKLMERIETSNTNQERYAKKQYRMNQITALASVLMLCAVLYSCSLIIPRMNILFTNLEVVMEDIEIITDGLAKSNLPQMINDIDRLVTSSEQSVQDALNKINAIDIATLNKAIKDLSDIINPIARLFGKG